MVADDALFDKKKKKIALEISMTLNSNQTVDFAAELFVVGSEKVALAAC